MSATIPSSKISGNLISSNISNVATLATLDYRNVTPFEQEFENIVEDENIEECLMFTTDYMNARRIINLSPYNSELKGLLDKGRGSDLIKRLYMEYTLSNRE